MLLTELNLYWTQNIPLNASVPLNVNLESLFRCCSSAHSHPAFTGLEVYELRRGKQHMHRCRSRERSHGTVRVLFSLLVPLFLGSSSHSIRALSRRAVCINSPPLCGLHHCHSACIWQMAVVFTSTSTDILWNTIILCCCAFHVLLFPGRLYLVLTGILHFSDVHTKP